MSNVGWIGVDLDGTLAHYTGWKGAAHIGEPIPAMQTRVKGWLAEGQAVRIFTARVYGQEPGSEIERIIMLWCLEHLGAALPVTCVKDFSMVQLWDDRAVRVTPNVGEPCCEAHAQQ